VGLLQPLAAGYRVGGLIAYASSHLIRLEFLPVAIEDAATF
jgi:hypothetical protein